MKNAIWVVVFVVLVAVFVGIGVLRKGGTKSESPHRRDPQGDRVGVLGGRPARGSEGRCRGEL